MQSGCISKETHADTDCSLLIRLAATQSNDICSIATVSMLPSHVSVASCLSANISENHQKMRKYSYSSVQILPSYTGKLHCSVLKPVSNPLFHNPLQPPCDPGREVSCYKYEVRIIVPVVRAKTHRKMTFILIDRGHAI